MSIYYRCSMGGSDDITYLAEDYNESKQYHKGDIVAFEGQVYEGLADTTGSFDNSKWKAIYFVELPELEARPVDDVDYIAPTYDPAETYNTDDVVLYAGLMYKITADNVTGEWDTTKAERINMVELGELNANLGGLDKSLKYVEHYYVRSDISKTISITESGNYLLYIWSNASSFSATTPIVINVSTVNGISLDTDTKEFVSGYASAGRLVAFTGTAGSTVSVTVTNSANFKNSGYILLKTDKKYSLSFDSFICGGGAINQTLSVGKYIYFSEAAAASSGSVVLNLLNSDNNASVSMGGVHMSSGSEGAGAYCQIFGAIDASSSATMTMISTYSSGYAHCSNTMFIKVG